MLAIVWPFASKFMPIKENSARVDLGGDAEYIDHLRRKEKKLVSEQVFATVSPELLESACRLICAGAAENRSDLSELLGVSSSTASNIARSLVSQKRVREVEQAASRGGGALRNCRGVALPALAAIVASWHPARALRPSRSWVGPVTSAEASIDLTPGPARPAERSSVVEQLRERRLSRPRHQGGRYRRSSGRRR